MTKHETISADEIESYITYLWYKLGGPMTRSGNIDLARLKERLKTATNTNEELQAFMEWRKTYEKEN